MVCPRSSLIPSPCGRISRNGLVSTPFQYLTYVCSRSSRLWILYIHALRTTSAAFALGMIMYWISWYVETCIIVLEVESQYFAPSGDSCSSSIATEHDSQHAKVTRVRVGFVQPWGEALCHNHHLERPPTKDALLVVGGVRWSCGCNSITWSCSGCGASKTADWVIHG